MDTSFSLFMLQTSAFRTGFICVYFRHLPKNLEVGAWLLGMVVQPAEVQSHSSEDL